MEKVVPLLELETKEMCPSCSSIIFFEIANPSPVPLVLVEKFGAKIFF